MSIPFLLVTHDRFTVASKIDYLVFYFVMWSPHKFSIIYFLPSDYISLQIAEFLFVRSLCCHWIDGLLISLPLSLKIVVACQVVNQVPTT